MATIKMGAIITEIAGSVGGTNFRRFRGTFVMSNKSFGASKNRLLNNVGLFRNVKVIQEWANLTQSARDNWIDAALLFQFPDKFGDLKNLSGRELYIKLITQIRNSTWADPDPTTLDSTVDAIAIDSGEITTLPKAEVILDAIYANSCMLVQVQRMRSIVTGPVYNKRKVITKENNAYTDEITFTTGFWNTFPYAQIGDLYRVYISPINESGFIGLTQTIVLTIS